MSSLFNSISNAFTANTTTLKTGQIIIYTKKGNILMFTDGPTLSYQVNPANTLIFKDLISTKPINTLAIDNSENSIIDIHIGPYTQLKMCANKNCVSANINVHSDNTSKQYNLSSKATDSNQTINFAGLGDTVLINISIINPVEKFGNESDSNNIINICNTCKHLIEKCKCKKHSTYMYKIKNWTISHIFMILLFMVFILFALTIIICVLCESIRNIPFNSITDIADYGNIIHNSFDKVIYINK